MILPGVASFLAKRSLIFIVFATSTFMTLILFQLAKHGVTPLSSNSIYGPFRWWNTEVVPTHTSAIIDSYSMPEGPKAIFAPSMPSNASRGYFSESNGLTFSGGVDAGVPLRFVEGGSAYGSFPPLAFILTWCFSLVFKGVGLADTTIKSLGQVNILVFILTSFNLSLAGVKILARFNLKNTLNQFIVVITSNLILLTSPIILYMLAVNQLWVHQWILYFVTLAVLSLFLPVKEQKIILSAVVVILPFLSYAAIPIQVSIVLILIHKKLFSGLTNTAFLLMPNFLLFIWVYITFSDFGVWFSTITSRSQSRIGVLGAQSENLSYFDSLMSLMRSTGWSFFGTLVFTFLLAVIVILNFKKPIDLKMNNSFRYAWIIAFAFLIEMLLIPGHAFIYSFAQSSIVVTLWISFLTLFVRFSLSAKMNNRQSSIMWIAFASLLLILNYSTTVVIYDSGRSYDVVTGEGL